MTTMQHLARRKRNG